MNIIMESSNNTAIKNQTIKNNSIINRIFDNDYLASLEYVVSVILKRNDVQNASILLKVLNEAIAIRKGELEANKEVYDFYKEVLIKLKFIAFQLLDDEECIDLIKNYFVWQFNLPDYDIREKLSGKLLNILTLEDRDKFKTGLKAALLGNNEKITSRAEIKTIADWLRNYNAKLGVGIVDNLKRVEYMVGLTKVRGLEESHINWLKTLFDFYEAIKVSSLTPAGFDEEIPMVVDNKLQIFRRGILEPVKEVKISYRAIEKKSEPPVKSEVNNDLAELKELVASFPPGSFERKTVEEEIERMNHE